MMLSRPPFVILVAAALAFLVTCAVSARGNEATSAKKVYVSSAADPKPYPEGPPWKWRGLAAEDIESRQRKQDPWIMGETGARHPVVLFDPSDVPVIRERMKKGMGPKIMAHLRRKAQERDMIASGMYAVLTGEEGPARSAIRRLVALASREPASHRLAHGGQLYRLAMGYDLLYNLMTPEQRRQVRTGLDRSAQQMYFHTPVGGDRAGGNWVGHCWVPLAIAGYALSEENRYAESWIRQGRVASLLYLHNTFDPDGADYEAFSRYFAMGMGPVIITCAAERRQGRDFFTYRGNIFNRIVEFASYMLVPYKHQSARPIDWKYMWVPYDDAFAVSNDSPSIWAAIAGLTKDPLAQWLFEATSPGTPAPYVSDPVLAAAFYDPEVPTESPDASKRMSLAKAFRAKKGRFPGKGSSGHVFLRTGFDDKETVIFSAQCGDTGGWHGHADQSSFFLYAYGDRLVMDPAIIGSYGEPLCEWMKGPEAHSLVLIDGQATPDYTVGDKLNWPRRFSHAGEVDGFVRTDTLDLVSMDFREGLALNPKIRRSRQAKRYVLFFRLPERRAYVVIVDDVIRDDAKRRYEWLLQPDDKHKIVKEGPGMFAFDGVPTKGRGFESSGTVDLKIRMIEPPDPAHEIAVNPPKDPRYVKYLRLRSREDRKRGLFLTVLYPAKKEGMTLPPITEIRRDGVIGATIGEDIVLFNTERGGTIEAAGVKSDGELVAIRISNGAPANAVVLNGTSLSLNGKPIPFEKAVLGTGEQPLPSR